MPPEPQESTPVSAPPASWHAPEWPADDGPAAAGEGERSGPSPPRGSQARRHREVLAVAIVVLTLSFLLVELPGGRVAVRGLTRYPLPPTCALRTVAGIRCPGCGLTRSFIHLAEGDWRASWRCHRLGGLLAAVLIFQVPYRLLALRRPERPPIPVRWQSALGGLLIALLIVNWLAEVVTGRLASL